MRIGDILAAFCVMINIKGMFWKRVCGSYFDVGTFKYIVVDAQLIK